MTSATPAADTAHEQDLLGQTVVLIGGSSGMGLETARLARAHGAEVVLTGRDPDRLRDAAQQVDARSTAAFDVTDLARVEQFFAELPEPIDHVMFTGGGPYYSPLADMDFDEARRDVVDRILVTLAIARYGAARMRPPGTLLFIGGTGGRQTGVGFTLISAMTAALPPLVANLALELAPSGSTSSPPASSTRPCRRRSSATSSRPAAPSSAPRSPSAAWSDRPTSPRSAVHLMTNTALTGATYDIDGGQQLLSNRGATR